MPIDRAAIDAAERRLRPLLAPTPLVASSWLSARIGADVWLKLEQVQPTGSFKVRGALNALLARTERGDLAPDVVAASAGNHGLALAWASRQLGITARIYVPATAPRAKREAIAALGGAVVETASYDAAEQAAKADAARTGAPYISPYNDLDVIAGAATAAVEILRSGRGVDTLIVPLGGGGLLAGVAAAIGAAERPGAPRLLGAEADASPVFTRSLARGAIATVDVGPTIADGLAGNLEPGSITFELVRRGVERVLLVPEAAIAGAMRELVASERLVAEGAGAIGVAAALAAASELRGRCVGILVTGRNVDWERLRETLGV